MGKERTALQVLLDLPDTRSFAGLRYDNWVNRWSKRTRRWTLDGGRSIGNAIGRGLVAMTDATIYRFHGKNGQRAVSETLQGLDQQTREKERLLREEANVSVAIEVIAGTNKKVLPPEEALERSIKGVGPLDAIKRGKDAVGATISFGQELLAAAQARQQLNAIAHSAPDDFHAHMDKLTATSEVLARSAIGAVTADGINQGVQTLADNLPLVGHSIQAVDEFPSKFVADHFFHIPSVPIESVAFDGFTTALVLAQAGRVAVRRHLYRNLMNDLTSETADLATGNSTLQAKIATLRQQYEADQSLKENYRANYYLESNQAMTGQTSIFTSEEQATATHLPEATVVDGTAYAAGLSLTPVKINKDGSYEKLQFEPTLDAAGNLVLALPAEPTRLGWVITSPQKEDNFYTVEGIVNKGQIYHPRPIYLSNDISAEGKQYTITPHSRKVTLGNNTTPQRVKDILPAQLNNTTSHFISNAGYLDIRISESGVTQAMYTEPFIAHPLANLAGDNRYNFALRNHQDRYDEGSLVANLNITIIQQKPKN